MIVFQSHQVFPGGLFLDLVLCLLPIFIFLTLKKHNFLPKIGKQVTIFGLLVIYCFVLILPNSTYAFFEIKHTLNSDLISFLVFGGVSLVGLVCTLITNMIIVNYYAKRKIEMFLYYSLLSAACGFGATIGLLDYSSLVGLNPFELPFVIFQLFRYPALISLASITSILIFLIGYITRRFLFKPSFL